MHATYVLDAPRPRPSCRWPWRGVRLCAKHAALRVACTLAPRNVYAPTASVRRAPGDRKGSPQPRGRAKMHASGAPRLRVGPGRQHARGWAGAAALHAYAPTAPIGAGLSDSSGTHSHQGLASVEQAACWAGLLALVGARALPGLMLAVLLSRQNSRCWAWQGMLS